MKKAYKIIERFECCGKEMVAVIMNTGTVSIMPLTDFNRIVEEENKYLKHFQ